MPPHGSTSELRAALEKAARSRPPTRSPRLEARAWPLVRGGEVVLRQMGYISVTFDHRVVDGAEAAAFGLDVIRRLERA